MTRIGWMTGLLTALVSVHAEAIRRHDVLTCGLKGGAQVELRASYEWSLLGSVLSSVGDVSVRTDRKGYDIYFMDTKTPEQAPGWVYYSRPVDAAGSPNLRPMEDACAGVGLLDGFALANKAFRDPRGTWRRVGIAGRKLMLTPVREQSPPWLAQALRERDWFPAFQFALMRPFGAEWVYEHPVGTIASKQFGSAILAVYQSVSTDGGRSWTDPILTPDARIFEIGRSLREQSFVGRPVAFNGRRFEPHFPSPQTRDERERVLQSLPAQWREVVRGPVPTANAASDASR